MAKWIQGLVIALLVAFVTGTFAFAGGSSSPQPQESDGTTTGTGWLGIAVANINERLVDHFGLTVSAGVVIVKVNPDGPGATGGLQVGDVIRAIDAAAVSTADQVAGTIKGTAPGTTVTITVLRDGVESDVPVIVGERPEPLVYQNPLPSYARRLITPELLKNLLHAEFQLQDKDGQVINVALTLGKVKAATDAGLLTVTRKDGMDAQFQTTADTRVAMGRNRIKLAGFVEGTLVLAVEKDNQVTAVVGGLRDILRHRQPIPHTARPRINTPPPARLAPDGDFHARAGALREWLERLGPGQAPPEKLLRQLSPEMRQRLNAFQEALRDQLRVQDDVAEAPVTVPAQESDGNIV